MRWTRPLPTTPPMPSRRPARSSRSTRRTGTRQACSPKRRSDATPRVRFTGGIRGDAVRNTNRGGYFGNRSVSNAAMAGLVAATDRSRTGDLDVTGQVARGFRDPTLSDRFYRGPVGRGFIEGNPDLNPETSLQFDVKARYVMAASASQSRRINTRLRTSSSATPQRRRCSLQESGRAKLRGIEVEARAPLRGWLDLAFSAETSRGRDANDHTPLDDIAPPAVSIALRHHLGARLISYVRAKAVRSHDAAGPSEVPTTGYTMVDGAVRWRWTENCRSSARSATSSTRPINRAPVRAGSGRRAAMRP